MKSAVPNLSRVSSVTRWDFRVYDEGMPLQYPLAPYTSPDALKLDFTVDLERNEATLLARFHAVGEIHKISLPPRASSPQRKNELWKSTCFELFISPEGESRYWEINVSPEGHWNLYAFDEYRKGMREEPEASAKLVSLKPDPKSLELSVEVRLPDEVSRIPVLECGITAVILDPRTGGVTYWALKHGNAEKADFHDRRGWIARR